MSGEEAYGNSPRQFGLSLRRPEGLPITLWAACPTDGRWGPLRLRGLRRAAATVVAGLAGALVVSGCAGASGPDASGSWWGEIVHPSDGPSGLVLDLNQSDEGEVNGSLTVRPEGTSEEVGGTLSGTIDDEGYLQLETDSGFAGGFSMAGTVEERSMDGEAFTGEGDRLEFSAERTADDAEQGSQPPEGTEPEPASGQDDTSEGLSEEQLAASVERAEELEDSLAQHIDASGTLASRADPGEPGGLRARTDTLEGAEENLQDVLEGPVEDSCIYDSIRCDAEGKAGQLEADREDLLAYGSGELDPVGVNSDRCSQVASLSYWEANDGISRDVAEGYEVVRGEVQAAERELEQKAGAAVTDARELSELRSSVPEGTLPETDYPSEEVQEVADSALDASKEAQEALADAEERLQLYEQRAEEATEEALTLYQAAGCS